jgi:hypothetical protein
MFGCATLHPVTPIASSARRLHPADFDMIGSLVNRVTVAHFPRGL